MMSPVPGHEVLLVLAAGSFSLSSHAKLKENISPE